MTQTKITSQSEPANGGGLAGTQSLEHRANRDPAQMPADELESLVASLSSSANDSKDFRVKQRLLKRAAFLVRKAFDSGVQDAVLLRKWMDVVQSSAALHSFPQDLRKLHSQLTRQWLEASGHSEPPLLARKKASLSTEVATFALGDANIAPATPLQENLDPVWMRTGERMIFRTGSDGIYRFEIRLIDAEEPVLEAKEYARVVGSTPSLVLGLPTGRLGIASLHDMIAPWGTNALANSVEMKLAPSNHKICVYSKASGDITVVLCRTQDPLPNKVEGMDVFTLFA